MVTLSLTPTETTTNFILVLPPTLNLQSIVVKEGILSPNSIYQNSAIMENTSGEAWAKPG
jgi:hypothetical protein